MPVHDTGIKCGKPFRGRSFKRAAPLKRACPFSYPFQKPSCGIKNHPPQFPLSGTHYLSIRKQTIYKAFSTENIRPETVKHFTHPFSTAGKISEKTHLSYRNDIILHHHHSQTGKPVIIRVPKSVIFPTDPYFPLSFPQKHPPARTK